MEQTHPSMPYLFRSSILFGPWNSFCSKPEALQQQKGKSSIKTLGSYTWQQHGLDTSRWGSARSEVGKFIASCQKLVLELSLWSRFFFTPCSDCCLHVLIRPLRSCFRHKWFCRVGRDSSNDASTVENPSQSTCLVSWYRFQPLNDM